MRSIHLAALAALSVVGIGIAFASQGGAVFGDFTALPSVIAQAPMQNAAALATTRNGQRVQTSCKSCRYLAKHSNV